MTQRQLKAILDSSGIEDSAFDARQLICHFERCSSADAAMGDFFSPELFKAVERRKNREPLQYILGSWSFMGFEFKVTPDCLIPRPDTELLCETLINSIPFGGKFADLCTGSGCIAISALKLRDDIIGVAVEKYEKTMEVAKENTALHNLEDRLLLKLADVTEDCLEGEYDVIVSNPPYVTADEMRRLQREVTFEPAAALTDGGDGLSIIRKIIEIYPAHLKNGGTLAIEFGAKQGPAVLKIAEEYGHRGEILKDIEGRDRVLIIKK